MLLDAVRRALPHDSALYTHPLDRFELPLLTMIGIVDNDKVHLPGTMPFFWLKGVRGMLPAGTPYAQIIPFKRERWEAEIETSLDALTRRAGRSARALRRYLRRPR